MATQTIAEILKKVQRIEIIANRAVNDLMAGHYKSTFRGHGMEFEEVREYQPGDDVRTIDWNVTARATGNAYVKQFCEERELTVLFLVDVSASGVFGTGDQSKLELVTEIAALLMFSALRNNDKVGVVLFADEVLQYFPPRKGKANVLRLIRELLAIVPVPRETDLAAALQFLNRLQKRRAVVFLISDFIAAVPQRTLNATNRRHDLIAIRVTDPRERCLPDVGFITLEDAETGEVREVDTRHPHVRDLFQSWARMQEADTNDVLRKASIDQLPVNTVEPYASSLRKFFETRERRFR
jgi:uncharacterized protein (DUF58 family)